MKFEIILKAIPYIIFVTPFITQGLKMAFDPSLKSNPNHDNIIRLATAVIAGIVGAFSLYFLGLQPTNFHDWAVTILTLIGYTVGGGLGASSAYAFLNGYLRQTPVISKATPVVGTTSNGNGEGRQPY